MCSLVEDAVDTAAEVIVSAEQSVITKRPRVSETKWLGLVSSECAVLQLSQRNSLGGPGHGAAVLADDEYSSDSDSDIEPDLPPGLSSHAYSPFCVVL